MNEPFSFVGIKTRLYLNLTGLVFAIAAPSDNVDGNFSHFEKGTTGNFRRIRFNLTPLHLLVCGWIRWHPLVTLSFASNTLYLALFLFGALLRPISRWTRKVTHIETLKQVQLPFDMPPSLWCRSAPQICRYREPVSER